MNWFIKARLLLYFLLFVLPFIGTMNCSGWNEESMTVSTCVIESTLFIGYTNFYNAFVSVSAFMMGIPVLVYGATSFLLIELILYLVSLLLSSGDKRCVDED